MRHNRHYTISLARLAMVGLLALLGSGWQTSRAQPPPVLEPQPLLPAPAESASLSLAAAPPSLPNRYLEVEYLLWGLDNVTLPRLLTSNPVGTPLASVGQSSDPSTQTVVGDEVVGDWPQAGMRFRAGQLMESGPFSRMELSGFFLFDRSDDWHMESETGDPILARPFTDADGQSDAQILSLAGVADGSLHAHYKRRFYGIEPLAFFCVEGNGCRATEFFTGYRYMRYEDQITITERVRPEAGGLIAPGTEFLVEDIFRATNDYHVLPLGLSYTGIRNAWRLDARALLALGLVHQRVTVRGRTQVSVLDDVESESSGGFLALPPDLGTHDQTEFAWIPELNVTLRRCLRGGLWMHVGYTIMHLNDVVQAPAQISGEIDPAALPPPTSAPENARFVAHSSDAWVHGLNVGIQWNY